ncbi:DUF6671 family protein [Polynucleobacter necessarius]|uniref:DUF6671 family protein n=1 Tax=Polynucleobacter necessarius TaxID=576610 RepID=UPI000E090E70|nr:DUF6671 family protein [Polynucleobacter necessarius]
MNTFANRSASLLTKHGKEATIGPLFTEELQCHVVHTDGYDTDLLGTFTNDVARYGSQLDAARKKAKLGMELLNLDLGIANEGAFVSDPYSGMTAWNNELVILIDEQQGLEITGFSGPQPKTMTLPSATWKI